MVHIRGFGILPCATFVAWPATTGVHDGGYAQTKTRSLAMSAPGALAGTPSPEAHHLVKAASARRNKWFQRGSLTPLLCSELPQPTPGMALDPYRGIPAGLLRGALPRQPPPPASRDRPTHGLDAWRRAPLR